MDNTLINTLDVEQLTVPSFIEANTVPVQLLEIQHNHIIPVYVKDNEPLISHADFINATGEVVSNLFQHEIITHPHIRVSHPIKGRVPEAKDKPAKQLEEWEKTLYYERLMFVVEIPTIQETIEGNTLSLTIGGVKSYSHDNLYNRKGADEHFTVFIGFQNKVCTNLCVWTDGLKAKVKVRNITQLMQELHQLIVQYRVEQQVKILRKLPEYVLTEHQFATLIGRCKLYQYLPSEQKKGIQPLTFGDTQISTIARDYYQDYNFSRSQSGEISLWNVYNLFTGANKSSYIDTFLPRSVNATSFVEELVLNMDQGSTNWFLN
ncbi:DUF3871 family protein [Telluribacter humicola]|uniref:DUF3871 family protein n=1 Tax=Telluribacter humicola TaxID=1720261 RepID=UPI001A9768B4|nr:DUF3871 family protein [Telluribacter humicola]